MSSDAATPQNPILTLTGVSKTFTNLAGEEVVALKPLDLAIRPGEIVAVVGESGSGKSTLGRIALGILRPDTGDVRVRGKSWATMGKADRKAARALVQPIFQDPTTSLNPRRTIRSLMTQASWAYTGDRAVFIRETLANVGLRTEEDFLDRHPHELSGGQRQRLSIARALAMQPSVIVADEPLSGADVSLRGQVLNLMLKIRQEMGVSYLMITHDISIARYFAHRVLVMKDGEVVEKGDAETVVGDPKHPYTQKLLNSTGLHLPKSGTA
ncbi:ATP-binding cassette domain-containing protein [Salipiger sp. P9]|uniref:ABC transporter ATP-binding protein n=1 Tax=Salipiger pentaromativorans TaxID=2943193 RepID=UPI0021577258|nr:ABC transporter ATP-binding protein [Salipiger pentaromativorans]MCR8549207.1 ATP-binding cassette domain-containing protein [Salipiger pentaromativorans]